MRTNKKNIVIVIICVLCLLLGIAIGKSSGKNGIPGQYSFQDLIGADEQDITRAVFRNIGTELTKEEIHEIFVTFADGNYRPYHGSGGTTLGRIWELYTDNAKDPVVLIDIGCKGVIGIEKDGTTKYYQKISLPD